MSDHLISFAVAVGASVAGSLVCTAWCYFLVLAVGWVIGAGAEPLTFTAQAFGVGGGIVGAAGGFFAGLLHAEGWRKS